MSNPTLSPARVAAIFAERDRLVQAQQAWREDAAEDRRHGYRPHYCIHGTNQWTDYDNICGGCEDGTFTQYTRGVDLLIVARDNVDYQAAAHRATLNRAAADVVVWFQTAIELSALVPLNPLAHTFQQIMHESGYANPRRR